MHLFKNYIFFPEHLNEQIDGKVHVNLLAGFEIWEPIPS